MAKRGRNKNSKPNLPDDVLARARKNAGVEDPEPAQEVAKNDDSVDSASVSERAARRRKKGTVQLERSRKRGEMTNEMINDALAHPTKIVTEEELHEDYQHVLVDLRNMGVLAAILIVVMMGLAVLIPPF
ncbi:MAG: hypothetical protein Phog2KO_07580 [Phototrophicaceae bacterium]